MSHSIFPARQPLYGRKRRMPPIRAIVGSVCVLAALAALSIEFALALTVSFVLVFTWYSLNFSVSYLAVPCLIGLVIAGILSGMSMEDVADAVAVTCFFGLVSAVVVLLARRSWSVAPGPQQRVATRNSWRRVISRADYIVTCLVALLAAQSWFDGGKLLAFGDFYSLSYTNSDVVLDKATQLWNTLSSGTGGRNFTIVQLPAVLLSQWLQDIGLSGEVAQRVILTLLFAAEAFAIVFLLRTIWPKSSMGARTAGALFYVFNPLAFYLVPGPVHMFGLALMPLLAALFLRSLRQGGRKGALAWAICTMGLAYVAANPPLALVVLVSSVGIAAMVHLSEGGGVRPIIRFFALAGPISLLLNLWWIVPALLTLSTTPVSDIPTSPDDWGWTQVRNSIANVFTLNTGWGWNERIYYPYAPVYEHVIVATALYLPAVVAFAALAFKKSREELSVVLFATVALVLFFVSKGIHAPFNEVNRALFDHVPGFALLREPALKLLPAASVMLAGMIVASVDAAIELLRRRSSLWKQKRLPPAAKFGLVVSAMLVLGAGLALPTAAMPLASGDVVADERPVLPGTHVVLPQYWQEMAAYLNSLPEERQPVLLLPLSDYYQMPYKWGYYGTDAWATEIIDRPVVFGGELTYISSSAARRSALALERAVLEGAPEQAIWRAQTMGVKYIILRQDLDREVLARLNRKIPKAAALKSPLEKNEQLQELRSFGPLSLFQVQSSPDLISAWDEVGWWIRGSGTPPRGVLEAGLAPAVLTSLDSEPVNAGDLKAFIDTHSPAFASRRRDFVPVQIPLLADEKVIRGTPILTRKPVTMPLSLREAMYVQFDSGLPQSAAVDRKTITVAARWDSAHNLEVEQAQGQLISNGSFERSARDGWSAVRDCARYLRADNNVRLRATLSRISHRGDRSIRIAAVSRLACVIQRFKVGPRQTYELSYANNRIAGARPEVCLFAGGRCLNSPSPQTKRDWQVVTEAVKVPSGVRSARLFLYADGTEERTVSVYDSLSVKRLQAVRSYKLRWQEGVEPIGWNELDSIPQRVRSTSAASSANLVHNPTFEEPIGRSFSGWSHVADCNRIDEGSLKELGIDATRNSDGPDGTPALRLEAERNSACVSQRLQVEPSEAYALSFVHRSLGAGNPSICIFVPSTGKCLELPEIKRSASWATYQTRFEAPQPDTYVELFLYASGTGESSTINLYDDVEVSAVNFRPQPMVVLDRPDADQTELDFSPLSNSLYRLTVTNAKAPFVLTLNQSFDTGWRLRSTDGTTLDTPHFVANGFANAWIIDEKGSYNLVLEFEPERWARLAGYVSLGTLLLLTMFPLVRLGRTRLNIIRREM
jgi:hypothetical protein